MFINVKTTVALFGAALAVAAAPAFADKPAGTPSPNQHAASHTAPGQASATHGTATAPGQLCKRESRKKTNHGKGKSAFAACVVGVNRARANAKRAQQTGTTPKAPGRLCKDQSRKKAASDRKSPFAACVTGAAKAQHAG
jgi:hypothetical protein